MNAILIISSFTRHLFAIFLSPLLLLSLTVFTVLNLSVSEVLASESGETAVNEEYEITTGEITIKTDKKVYTPNGVIAISVANDSTTAVFIHKNDSIAINAIERIEKDGTRKKMLVRDPNVRYDIAPPEEFTAGESYKFEWTPIFYEKKEGKQNGYDIYESSALPAGRYRLVFIFQKRPSGVISDYKWILSNSNEFEISE